MRSLPVELISHIFSLACEPEDSRKIGYATAVLKHLLAISAVCSSWRTVALSTQTLWSTITVKPISKDDLEGVLSLLKMFLVRAHSVPLDMSLILHYELSKADFKRLWDVISGCLPRCRSLEISGAVDLSISLPLQTTDSLRRLRIWRSTVCGFVYVSSAT